jgi:hypothetical protein
VALPGLVEGELLSTASRHSTEGDSEIAPPWAIAGFVRPLEHHGRQVIDCGMVARGL